MTNIFLATLGQRPEAITMALDALLPRYDFSTVAILHTEPTLSDIAPAYDALKTVLAEDYPQLSQRWHELCRPDGSPLLDIHDQTSATDYYRAIYDVLREYKQQRVPLHLLVAGGRKAMSIYGTLAASLLFTQSDRVWTILSPSVLIHNKGMFHAPDRMRDQIQMVQLPVKTARLLPGSVPEHLLEDPERLHTGSQRVIFLSKLTRQERKLVETLQLHPYVSNQELADLLHKSKRTIETQFRSIYSKLIGFLDFGEEISNKRQALLDVLNEE